MMEEATDNNMKVTKMEVDYSSTVDEKLKESELLAKDGKISEAMDSLLSLEKQTRTGADTHSTGRLLVAMVKLAYDHKKWDLLNETLVLLTKRRGQIKQAVTKMVQEACTYVEKVPDMEIKLKLIDTLRTITSGKIYVEIERARLTRILAQIKEDQGDITEAANILQELQVETFGSMDKKEKVEFILEQMRLCLAKKDFIRTQIISKKISPKFFEDKTTEPLKLKFYQLMIEIDQHENLYLAICKHYRAIYDTDTVKEDTTKKNDALKCIVLYLLLAPFDNEQSDLTHRIAEETALQELPLYKALLDEFCASEIIRWRVLCSGYEAELRQSSVFSPGEAGDARWAALKERVVEHNVRVLARYYTRLRLARMAELLELSEADAEQCLSQLVVAGTVTAKIDRPQGIVHFKSPQEASAMLDDWSHNVTKLMRLLNSTTHLINKEQMVHQVAFGQ